MGGFASEYFPVELDEGLDGRGGGWNSLISKNLAHCSLSYSLKNPLFFKMLIDFRQLLYDSVVKVLFIAYIFFFLFFFSFFFLCITEMRRQI